jgi:hypothetical protein
MTAIIPVLDPMNGSDHPPALPLSATRGSALKLSSVLASLQHISVSTFAVSAATWQVRLDRTAPTRYPSSTSSTSPGLT